MRSSLYMSLYSGSTIWAKRLFEVLNPEVRSDSKVSTRLGVDGSMVNLHLEASDRSAMRAAVNSYGRWMALIEDIRRIP